MSSPSALRTPLRALSRQASRCTSSQNAASIRIASRLDTRNLSTTPARSAQPPPAPLKPQERDAITSFAASLRSSNTFRSTTEPYVAYGATEDLFKECARQCDYTILAALQNQPKPTNAAGEDVGEGTGWWFEAKEKGGLGLPVTFISWAHIMYIHMYVLNVRMRRFPKTHVRDWEQNLLDHFFHSAEDRMETTHGLTVRSMRNKSLKDLWLQWRGVLVSYDEGLIKGDAVLATAIWRNLFRGSEEADLGDVATVTSYLRRELRKVDLVEDNEITSGSFKFDDAVGQGKALEAQSPWLGKTFTKEDLAPLEQKTAQ